MIGSPLVDFICTTLTVCLGMTLAVVLCCFYIRCTAHRELQSESLAASAEDWWVTRKLSISWSLRKKNSYSDILASKPPLTPTLISPQASMQNLSENSSEKQLLTSSQNISQKNECCTIFVPDVGIIL